VAKILISYRREDVPVEARRIRDSLAARMGSADVAMTDDPSVAGREPGAKDVIVAVIGSRWLEILRAHASRGERDDVRTELATALRRGLTVIPVRVGRREAMPPPLKADDLPVDLRGLAIGGTRAITVDRLDIDTASLLASVQPVSVATVGERAPGNSGFKLLLWAAGVIAATVAFANFTAWLGGYGWQGSPLASAPPRPTINFSAWTGEGRIRRAIEAALAKGRRPDEARRCQSALISATEAGTILFATGSWELDQRSHQTLDTLARIIRDCPDFAIEVEGHTDNVGDPVANQRLSERRAASVRDYLVSAGVPAISLGVAGYGDTRPVAPNDTPANMARNRRIDLNVSVR
jgi:outer membrane protein OmpA-like peptidoglycan-associated protein